MLRLRLSRLLLLPDLLLVHLLDGYDPSTCRVKQMHIRINDNVSFTVIINVVRRRNILDYPHLVKYFPTSYDVNEDCERNVMINAYVHLLDPARRRVVAIRKMHEEKIRQQQQPTQSQPQHATTPPRDSPRRPQHQPGPKPAKPAPYKYEGPYANSQSGGKIRK